MENIQELLLQAMLSVVPPRSCRYAAGPLTTSKAYYQQLASGGVDVEAMRRHNQMRLSAFVSELRAKSPIPVVDPGLLRIDQWEGRHYGSFFLRVLQELCFEVWFLEGWEFS